MSRIDEMMKKKNGHHAFIIQIFDIGIWQIFLNSHLKKQICPKNFKIFLSKIGKIAPKKSWIEIPRNCKCMLPFQTCDLILL